MPSLPPTGLVGERRRHEPDAGCRPVARRRPPRRHRPTLITALRTVGGRAEPGDERVDHRRLVGEHVGVVPFGAGQDGDVGPIGVEVAGVLVGLDDERRSPALSSRGWQRRR